MKPSQAEWEQIVEQNYAELYRYAARFLGNAVDAEDATQECFMAAYLSWQGSKEPEAVRKWLFTILRNKCLDLKRKWKRWKNLILPAHGPDACVMQSVPGSPESYIEEQICKLPQRQREIFILRHWHGFSTEETAKLLGISPGSIKSHLSRAIYALKEFLKKDYPL